MLLATVFALLSLSASMLIFINIIKSGNIMKIKEMKSKCLIIGVSGKVLGLVLLASCSINAFAQQNQNQQQASTQTLRQEQAKNQAKEQAPKASNENKSESVKPVVTIYDSAAKFIEATGDYSIKNGTLKVISPKEFVLTRRTLPILDPDLENYLFRTNITFILLQTFVHTNIDELTLHTETEYINSPDIKPQKKLPDLSIYKMTLRAKRKDILAYFQKHYQINSFDELIDQNDAMNDSPLDLSNGPMPLDKYVKSYYGAGEDGEQEAWDFINTFKVN
nr:hypothetical protein [Snodgrassella alvi]